jgi:hypothetical protein
VFWEASSGLQLCIPEGGPRDLHYSQVTRGFSQSVTANVEMAPTIRPRPALPRLSISLIVLQLFAEQSQLLIAFLNSCPTSNLTLSSQVFYKYFQYIMALIICHVHLHLVLDQFYFWHIGVMPKKARNLKSTAGNDSLHEISNSNVVRAINYATPQNITVRRPMCPHHNIKQIYLAI